MNAFLSTTALLVGMLAVLPVPGWSADHSAKEVPKEFFGLHIHRIAKGTPWPAVPFGSWRLWDAYVAWPNLNPAPDRFDFSLLDSYVDQAAAKGVQLVLPLGLSPRWASRRPDEPSAYALGNAADPASLADWERYVATVVQRYRGRIGAYEIWNEPNRRKFFSGDVADAVTLACRAYAKIKAIDPGAKVVSPAPTDQKAGVRWVEDFLAAGGGRCVDAIGFHFYTLAHEPPEALVDLFLAVRSSVDKGGFPGLPVWNTESGWYVENARVPVQTRYRVLSPDLARAFIVRAFLLGAWLGMERYFWYAWDNGNYGLIEPDTRELKSVAQGYRTAVEWIAGKRISACTRPVPGSWVCQLDSGPAGSGRFWIVWSDQGETPWTPPASWGIRRMEQLDGAGTALAAGQPIRLTSAPLRLY